jgi:hypothetical protein
MKLYEALVCINKNTSPLFGALCAFQSGESVKEFERFESYAAFLVKVWS